jgi:cytidylate kinase
MNKLVTFSEVKKAMHIRDNLDKKRKNSPLIQTENAVIVRTDKLKNIKDMVNKMSEVIEKKIKEKYGS